MREKNTWELHKDTVCYVKQILGAASYKNTAVQPSYKPSKLYEQNIQGNVEEGQTQRWHFPRDSYSPVLVTLQKLIFIQSVWTQDSILKTYQEQWLIGMNGKRKSRESMLLAHFNDDEMFINKIQWKRLFLILELICIILTFVIIFF